MLPPQPLPIHCRRCPQWHSLQCLSPPPNQRISSAAGCGTWHSPAAPPVLTALSGRGAGCSGEGGAGFGGAAAAHGQPAAAGLRWAPPRRGCVCAFLFSLVSSLSSLLSFLVSLASALEHDGRAPPSCRRLHQHESRCNADLVTVETS